MSASLFWKLTDDGGVKPCSDSRHVCLLIARSEVDGRVIISTIFLGIDHAFGSGEAPILFETACLVRGRASDVLCRYRTFLEALDGHARYAADLFGVTPHQTTYGPIRALAHRAIASSTD